MGVCLDSSVMVGSGRHVPSSDQTHPLLTRTQNIQQATFPIMDKVEVNGTCPF